VLRIDLGDAISKVVNLVPSTYFVAHLPHRLACAAMDTLAFQQVSDPLCVLFG